MFLNAYKSSDRRALLAAMLAIFASLTLCSPKGSAKTPGAEYCFRGWCHRVSTIDEMDSSVGRRGYLTASFYDHCSRDRFNTCGLTSSGTVFHALEPDNAASPIFPDGTVILAYNPETQMAAVLRVTSAGPYHGDRKLDVSRGAAEKLGFFEKGIAQLVVSVLKSPNSQEARYKKMRVYDKVPGPIGKFKTFDEAEHIAVMKLAMQADVNVAVESRSSRSPADMVATDVNGLGVVTVAPSKTNILSTIAIGPSPAILPPNVHAVERQQPTVQLYLHEVALTSVATQDATVAQHLTVRLEAFWDMAQRAAQPEQSYNQTPPSQTASSVTESFLDRIKNFIDAARQEAKPQYAPQSGALAYVSE